MSCIRLARAFTGRDRSSSSTAAYHGHADALLVKAGSGCAHARPPEQRRCSSAFADLTISLRSTMRVVEESVSRKQNEIAAVIYRADSSQRGSLFCDPENFLSILREECTSNDALLIFDESSLASCCARRRTGVYGVKPDLTVLGKIIERTTGRDLAAARNHGPTFPGWSSVSGQGTCLKSHRNGCGFGAVARTRTDRRWKCSTSLARI